MKRLALALCLLPALASAQRFCDNTTGVTLVDVLKFSYSTGQTVQWMEIRLDFVDGPPQSYVGSVGGNMWSRTVTLPTGFTLTHDAVKDTLNVRGGNQDFTLPRCK